MGLLISALVAFSLIFIFVAVPSEPGIMHPIVPMVIQGK